MVILDMTKGLNHIGRLGENEHRTFRFPDSCEVLAMYPEATVSVLVKRPGDSVAYPVAPGFVEIRNGAVYWTVQSADLARIGRGNVELTFVDGTTVAKNIIYDVYVDKALDGAGDPPEPWESWQTDITRIAGEIAQDRSATEQAAEDAAEAQRGAEVAQDAAESAARDAAGSAGNAASSARAAEQSVTDAGLARDGAEEAQRQAEAAQGKAEDAQSGAEEAQGKAETAKRDAEEAAEAAATSERNAAGSVTDAAAQVELAKKYVDGKGTDGTVDPAYSENNAKHYSELTAQDARDAEGSKLAVQNMTAVAATLPAGSAATVTKTVDPQTGAVTLSFGIPKGQDGSGGGDVTDVQINGTSILDAQGVANIPKANRSNLGTIRVYSGDHGLSIDSNGILLVYPATSSDIKVGVQPYRRASVNRQHEATFYGLAKAAGADEKNSTLSVGQYTEPAKSAISEMLNGSVSVSGTTPSITALPGVRYVCGECATLDITLPASGCIDVVFESGSTATVLTITPPSGVADIKWVGDFDPTSLEANTKYEINIMDGEWGMAVAWT